jgi:hypothetical protein
MIATCYFLFVFFISQTLSLNFSPRYLAKSLPKSKTVLFETTADFKNGMTFEIGI